MSLPSSVRPIAWRHARRIVQAHHYLGYAPAGAKFCLGIYDDTHQLMGTMIFGRPVARLEDQKNTLELTRMVLFNGVPKNACSRALSLAEKWIKHHRTESRLIAYADPTQGHLGTIYKAANWELIGNVRCNPWSFREGRKGRIGGRIKRKFQRVLCETPTSLHSKEGGK